jgi:RimJ/RimL family protein N-acetyltransferase
MKDNERNEIVNADFDDLRPVPPTLVTPRLRLRTLQPGDEEFLAALDASADVMQYIHGGPLSPKAAMTYAKTQIELADLRWHLHKWIVELRENNGKIGWVELSKFRGVFDPNEKSRSDDVNLGYEFDKAHWGQGFASEAARAVLDHAFAELELERVVAFARKDNVRSTRVLEKLGFRQGPARRYRDEGGHVCQLFALSSDAWLS